LGYAHSTRETKSSSVSMPKKCARTQQVILLALGLIVVVGVGNHLVREVAKERRERNEQELFDEVVFIQRISEKLMNYITALIATNSLNNEQAVLCEELIIKLNKTEKKLNKALKKGVK